MNKVVTPPYRDPKDHGAPILPQPGWNLPPYHRWTFQHMREMTATAAVRRGRTPPRDFERDEQPLGQLRFESRGRELTLNAFLDESWTDGFLVLHRGRILAERYMNGMTPHRLHLSMSVAKSILGIVTGSLINRGVVDPGATVPQYLPELAKTAYLDVTIQQLLDMTSGVTFNEDYFTPGSHMQKLGHATAWGGRGGQPDWPQTIWELVLQLTEREREHGEVFHYRSIETDVLGYVVERVTEQPLAEIVSELLWQKLGAEEDGAYTVDRGGFALADGGFNATLRDYGRFGQMLADNGQAGDAEIAPADWIEQTRFGGGGQFGGIHAEILPDGGYHNGFWQVDRKRGTILAIGIYGQYIYVDPDAALTVVKLSTWPGPLDADGVKDTVAACKAVGQALSA